MSSIDFCVNMVPCWSQFLLGQLAMGVHFYLNRRLINQDRPSEPTRHEPVPVNDAQVLLARRLGHMAAPRPAMSPDDIVPRDWAAGDRKYICPSLKVITEQPLTSYQNRCYDHLKKGL